MSAHARARASTGVCYSDLYVCVCACACLREFVYKKTGVLSEKIVYMCVDECVCVCVCMLESVSVYS